MARKRDGNLYVLTGPGDTRIERNIPVEASEGAALTWAVGVLCFTEGDNRPGTEVPVGDYLLTLIGPRREEPLFKIRKHTYDTGQTVCSWEPA